MNTILQRKHDLDWLRVIAFGLLIFYHIGMFYVSWSWHVKSVHASDQGELPMMLLNPWRLSLLFFISGVAIRFAMDKAPIMGRFTWSRIGFLFWPLLFGMLAIVTPQAWLQLVESGEFSANLIAFYPGYLRNEFSITTPTWNHLWYVAYILVYTPILALLARPIAKLMGGHGEAFLSKVLSGSKGILFVLILPALPHILFRFTLDPYFPTTHDLTGDWANHAHSFTFCLMGFWIAKSDSFWGAVRRAFPFAVATLIGLAVWLSPIWVNWDAYAESGANLTPARTGRVLYAWIAILSLLGFAQRYLNHSSALLSYLTRAIFPYYILHQTLTVLAGFYLTRMALSKGVEFGLVTLATIGGCVIGYEIIRRVPWLYPVFGLRRIKPAKDTPSSAALPAE